MACQQNGNQLPRDIPNKSGSWKTSWHRKPLQLKSLWERFVSTHWKVHTCIVFLMYFDDHFFTALLWNLRGTTFWLLMLTIINAQSTPNSLHKLPLIVPSSWPLCTLSLFIFFYIIVKRIFKDFILLDFLDHSNLLMLKLFLI